MFALKKKCIINTVRKTPFVYYYRKSVFYVVDVFLNNCLDPVSMEYIIYIQVNNRVLTV